MMRRLDDEMINLRESVQSASSVCNNNTVTIVPNPTTGELRIISGELKIDNIEVLDVLGKIVLSHHPIISSSNPKIDISNLHSGIYFIKVVTGHGDTIRKIVKQ